ncbi:MAG: asparagine synthase (glutamine-hydrolyzing) [Alphaproteobacteria bacterium]|nr:asparagine synthase (glutamine-hydrolyzing) [Alphaproteobacteria bacterium]
MCGIAGAVFCEVTDSGIEKALKAFQRRGPDAQRATRERNATFLHARLSIIDLSAQATQPMTSFCGRYVIVFNGEIYNYRELRQELENSYRFQTNSDTEVILALYAKYDARLLDKLRGMFAFAIWDKQTEELFVARDRLGVKPLYFAAEGGRFAFASRPKALCLLVPEIDRTIDRQALRYFLEAGYVPAPHSIFRGIKKLEPGCFLRVTRQAVVQERYWSLDKVGTDETLLARKEGDLLDDLEALINDSVRLRLVSDVPVGAFLSGGIDSSLVAAFMKKRATGPVRTFTIGFKEKEFDESAYAEAVAAHLGTEHTRETLAVDDLMALMPRFIEEYDEPFFDYSAFPVMAVSRLARRTVTVSLSGDGGDEAFGGYHYYRIMCGLEATEKIPFSDMIGEVLKHVPKQRLKWLGEILAMRNPTSAYAFMRGVIKDSGGILKSSLVADTIPLAGLFVARSAAFPHGLSYPEQAMRLDLSYTLPDDYLQKVDVGSMAFSLEARDPLLDPTIIEWAARLPMRWKIRGNVNKYLLRQLAYRHLPRALMNRKKMGFSLPMAHWLRTGLKAWGEELLADTQGLDALELDAAGVRKLWNLHQQGRISAHTALWSVLVLLQFLRAQEHWR